MIVNYTHKEWEAAQYILKHQGHVNHVLEEMGISCLPRPRPSTPGKKLQPLGNVGSEPTETSKKGKSIKTVVATEGSSKLAKASEALAQRKGEVAKTTLVPVAEKPSKLLKINETLIRQKMRLQKWLLVKKRRRKTKMRPHLQPRRRKILPRGKLQAKLR
jgi:hypothetical protein